MATKRKAEPPLRVQGFLGAGTYGTVFAVSTNETHENKALKVLRPPSNPSDTYEYQDIIREVFGLYCSKQLQTIVDGLINVSPGKGKKKERRILGLLMDHNGMSVSDCSQTFSLCELASSYRSIVEQLALVGGMHRDVKPSNILLPMDSKQNATLIDFSLCTAQNYSKDFHVVTLWYRAPEILANIMYNHKVDIWALGLVFLYAVTGKHFCRPESDTRNGHFNFLMDIFDHFGWPDTQEWPEIAPILKKMYRKGKSQGILDFKTLLTRFCDATVDTPDIIDLAADMFQKMLHVNPTKRIGWSTLLQHPFWAAARKRVAITHVSPLKYIKPCSASHLKQTEWLEPPNIFHTWTRTHSEIDLCKRTYDVTLNDIIRLQLYMKYANSLRLDRYTAYYACYLSQVLCAMREHNDMTSYDIFSCFFLAASFHEDIRIRPNSFWSEYMFEYNACLEGKYESLTNEETLGNHVLDTLCELCGHWEHIFFESYFESMKCDFDLHGVVESDMKLLERNIFPAFIISWRLDETILDAKKYNQELVKIGIFALSQYKLKFL